MNAPRTIPARFPFADRPRLWGVAVSHYQVEGNDSCDWTAWEADGKTRGEPCGRAAGSWERYESDVDLAVAAGANSFRFSISWSRGEPRQGEFDERALERYARLVDHCATRGVEPVITLFHYTHPSWFHDSASWASPRSVRLFERFSRRVAEALGDPARLYTVLNEPLVFLLAGYLDGQIPRGRSGDSGTSSASVDCSISKSGTGASKPLRVNASGEHGVILSEAKDPFPRCANASLQVASETAPDAGPPEGLPHVGKSSWAGDSFLLCSGNAGPRVKSFWHEILDPLL